MCHVMLDLETLGKSAGCAIVQIGACVFDLDGVRDEFEFSIDVATSPLRIEPETLAWWLRQDAAAIAAVFGSPKGSHARALTDFSNYWRDVKGEYLWSHGASFDPPILAYAYAHELMPEPWTYRAVRDTRTLFAMSGESVIFIDSAVQHTALVDARAQAEAAIRSFKKLGNFY